MKKIALIVIGYNRVNSISRLLQSLKQAEYYNMEVPLIISIDNGGSDEVALLARNFNWPYGEKTIIEHPKQLGLRNHVLFCGNLSVKYDAVVVLEDDIFVSPYFYSYVCQTVEKYDSDNRVAGISLYTHLWNEGANRAFTPQYTEYDVYFLQYAQSWGQVWTKRMWSQFYEWYKNNNGEFNTDIDLPNNIVNWPKSSWLKYYIRYTVKTNRYFIYPYVSLSTNFTDPGTHNQYSTTGYQVPLLWHEKKKYFLPDLTDNSLRYDVYFENQGLGRVLGISENDLNVDLYQQKNIKENKRFWITTKKCDFKIIESFALQLKPHEVNIINGLKGNDIFLYDTHQKEIFTLSKNINDSKALLIRYDVRAISMSNLIKLLKYEIKRKIKMEIKKFFRIKH